MKQKNACSLRDKRSFFVLLGWLIASCIILPAFYRVMSHYAHFEIVMIAYMVLCTAFVFGYVIYNRGFSRKGITPDMLPDSMSEEEKTAFIEDGKQRLRRSRWMLIVILGFVVTFALDLAELFVLPMVKGWFAG